MTISLFDYQQEAVNRLRAAYASGYRAPLLVLPTGGGKTFVFSFVTGSATAKGRRVLVLVHRRELLSQSSASLTALGIAHGCIGPGHPVQLRQAAQVASVQTVVRRFPALDRAGWRPDLIIIDEAHHATAGSWRRVLEHWPEALVLGVTATPCRTDGAGLGVDGGGTFDTMIEGPQIGELIERGRLAQPVVYAPPVVADLSGMRRSGGDWSRKDQEGRVDKPKVTGDAVEHYARICPGVPAIAFCVSVPHADHVAEQFRAAGWRAKCIHGGTPEGERQGAIDDLGAGRLDVLATCDIVSEGTDIPIVGAAILLRLTKSLGLYLQQVGRVLRAYEGKEEAVILDHVGNVQVHGLPDDPREWSLEGSKTKGRGGSSDGPPPPITCEGCFQQIRRPAPPACPSCGKSLKSASDRMERLEQIEGELQRITAEDRKRLAAERKAEQGQAETLGALVALAAKRGYKNPHGWAYKVWSKRNKNGRRHAKSA